jgi:hypothetical protein
MMPYAGERSGNDNANSRQIYSIDFKGADRLAKIISLTKCQRGFGGAEREPNGAARDSRAGSGAVCKIWQKLTGSGARKRVNGMTDGLT